MLTWAILALIVIGGAYFAFQLLNPPSESITEPPSESITEPPSESITEPPSESVTEPPSESPTPTPTPTPGIKRENATAPLQTNSTGATH